MYLGIDIGTSAVKAVLVDADGRVAAQCSTPLDVSRPRPLWSEQDPEHWWRAAGDAVRGLPVDLRRAVRGIGLSGQMHGATLLDARDRVLRPAILWNDGRSGRECADLEAAVPDLPFITGNRAMPGFTAPKLAWVRTHEPDVHRAVARVLLPKDFVRLRMTGVAAADVSDAAGTLWLNVAARRWSGEMLAATGLTEAQMPALVEGTDATGALLAACADAWGVPRVPVYGGGGDNAAGAVGVGVVRPGEAFLSLGTSGVLFLACESYRPNAAGGVHTFCHAVPGRWHQMSVILSAASCLDWAAKLTGCADAAELLARVEAADTQAAGSGAATSAATQGAEVFLPYLSGERTPHNDPHARGVLFGLTHDSDAARVGRAVLAGVAFAFRDGLDALAATGQRIGEIAVIGGGARSTYWGRILAAALGRPLTYRDGGTVGAAYGAAQLARLGHEHLDVETACTPPPVVHVVEPDPALVARCEARLPRFRSLYARLKHDFPETPDG